MTKPGTVFQSFSFIRPGKTYDMNGTLVPTDLRVTYNLDVPVAVNLALNPEREPGCDLSADETLILVKDLMENGATYCNDDRFMPGYVVRDEKAGISNHWQFFRDNKMHFFLHRCTDEKGQEIVFGKESDKPYRELTGLERDALIGVMDASKDGTEYATASLVHSLKM